MVDLYAKLKQFQHNTTTASTPQPPSTPAPLPEALRNIPGLMRGPEIARAAELRDEKKRRFLASIGVEERASALGRFGYKEIAYPAHTLPHQGDELTGAEMARAASDPRFASLDARGLAFIDTETTGLAGGTGTIPFLIGVGLFDESGFRVRQYLIRDYGEEEAALHALKADLEGFAALGTYNGKCFDVPLLRTRFLMNRIPMKWDAYGHFDLLYAARRLWKRSLPDCRLVTVEANVLGRARAEDIPSALIPYVYFDFLRGERLQRMKPVIAHNAEDILSLGLLAARVCRMLRAPEETCAVPGEALGLGVWLRELGQEERAGRLLEWALARTATESGEARELRWRLAAMYKRMRRWEQAAAHWRALEGGFGDLGALIELAKMYEHRLRLYQPALDCANDALRRLNAAPPAGANGLLEALQCRRERLMRKMTRG